MSKNGQKSSSEQPTPISIPDGYNPPRDDMRPNPPAKPPAKPKQD